MDTKCFLLFIVTLAGVGLLLCLVFFLYEFMPAYLKILRARKAVKLMGRYISGLKEEDIPEPYDFKDSLFREKSFSKALRLMKKSDFFFYVNNLPLQRPKGRTNPYKTERDLITEAKGQFGGDGFLLDAVSYVHFPSVPRFLFPLFYPLRQFVYVRIVEEETEDNRFLPKNIFCSKAVRYGGKKNDEICRKASF